MRLRNVIVHGLLVLIVALPVISGTETVEVAHPWSGHWWPMQLGENIKGYEDRGYPSVFDKFDALYQLERQAYDWEEANHYKPNGASWEGHCNGWAVASISEVEPTTAVNLSGLTFFVGDQKALWTEYYQGARGTVYGDREIGIDPLTFHVQLQAYLRDNDLPILMEEDPSDEVWNYPIYRYNMVWVEDGNTWHVTTTITCAWNTGLHPDDVGTIPRSFTYTYDLETDGGVPVSGTWTGDSVDDHPDILWYPDDVVLSNPYVTYDRVEAIADASYNTTIDDAAEDNDDWEEAAWLQDRFIPRSLDDDWYRIPLEPLELLTVDVYGNHRLNQNYPICKLYDGTGTFLEQLPQPATPEGPVEKIFEADGLGEQLLKVEYRINNAFRDNYQFHVSVDSGETIIPHTIDHFYWTHFIEVGFRPVTVEEETRWTSSFLPIGILDGEAWPMMDIPEVMSGTTFRELDFEGELPYPEWIKLNSLEDQYRTFSFYLSEGDGSMSFLEHLDPARQFMLAHVPDELNYWWYGLVLLNPSRFQEVDVTCTLYGQDGSIVGEETIPLNPYEKLVGVFEDIFPSYSQDVVSHMSFEAPYSFVASALYGTRNHRELSYVPGDSEYILPGTTEVVPIDPLGYQADGWTGFVFVNTADEAGYILLRWILRDGTDPVVRIDLEPHEKWVGVAEECMPEGTEVTDAVRVELTASGVPVSAFSLTGSHGKGTLVSYPFQPLFDGFDEIYPYVTRDGLETIPVLCNLKNLVASQVAMIAYDAVGNQVGDVAIISVPAWQRQVLNMADYFTVGELASVRAIRLSRDRYMLSAFVIVQDPDEIFCEILPPAGDVMFETNVLKSVN